MTRPSLSSASAGLSVWKGRRRASVHLTPSDRAKSWRRDFASRCRSPAARSRSRIPSTATGCTRRRGRSRRPHPPRWLLGRTWGSSHTNLRMESRSTQPDRSAAVGRARCRRSWMSLIPTRWAIPAPSCCIRTVRWKAATIRAPTGARRACLGVYAKAICNTVTRHFCAAVRVMLHAHDRRHPHSSRRIRCPRYRCARAGASACLGHDEVPAYLCAGWKHHGHSSCVVVRRHVLHLRFARHGE